MEKLNLLTEMFSEGETTLIFTNKGNIDKINENSKTVNASYTSFFTSDNDSVAAKVGAVAVNAGESELIFVPVESFELFLELYMKKGEDLLAKHINTYGKLKQTETE